jgi:hypothetical protein
VEVRSSGRPQAKPITKETNMRLLKITLNIEYILSDSYYPAAVNGRVFSEFMALYNIPFCPGTYAFTTAKKV